jgi:hypothetical protein
LTALSYYLENHADKDLYVITTANKRDKLDWEREAIKLSIGTERDATIAGVIKVDSWNNVVKHLHQRNAFFIFDEQRVVGGGAWVKAFVKIARNNPWILLSATPGDTWMDYAPVFIANEFYRNVTDFKREHVIYEPFVKYPKIRGYINTARLERHRNEVLVEMPYLKHTRPIMNYLQTGFDREMWNRAVKDRWNPFTEEPISDVSELFRVMRQIVNSDDSKFLMVHKLLQCHKKMVIFYNFNYELDMLRELSEDTTVAEYNGTTKDPIPDTDSWVYLVQYQAGAEGWNCTETNALVLFSLTYSYKNFTQALGRIDRLDTEFTDLYYYILATAAPIDNSVRRSLDRKEDFNESARASDVKNWVV